MTSPLSYCPTCGAANAAEDSICFACRQDLVPYTANNPTVRLLHQRYEILTQVGVGGFGAVYKARDIQNQYLVALKQINLRGLAPQEIIDATDGFNREVQMLSQLSHAHLPRFHAHFTDPEHWYVAMDYIEGETLEHYIHDTTSQQENAIRALALNEVLDISLQLCDVLTYLHTRQPPIIFRDLKPANLIRTPRGQLYLIDFGIARYFKPGQTRDTAPLGSPGYAAPEQYGRAQTDERADIYSLGALIYHLLSRRDPSETPFALPPLRVLGPQGMSDLVTLVTRMIDLNVEWRPVNISEVQKELQRIQAHYIAEPRIWLPAPGQTPPPANSFQAFQIQQFTHATSSPQSTQAQAQKKKRTRRSFLVGGLVATTVLGLGGFSYWKYGHPLSLTLTLTPGFPRPLIVSNSPISALALSFDGQYAAFALNDGSIIGIRLIDTTNFYKTFAIDFSQDEPDSPLNALAWSPDHTRLIAEFETGGFQLWDLISTQTHTVEKENRRTQAVAWSPDGQLIASLTDQQYLDIYDSRTTVLTANLVLDAGSGNAMAWAPDSRSIAVAQTTIDGASTLTIWDTSTSDYSDIDLSIGMATTLAWSPDGDSLAVLRVDNTLQVWGNVLQGGQSTLTFTQQSDTQYIRLAWSPDNHYLATIDAANNLLVLDPSNGNTLVSTSIRDSLSGVFTGTALAWRDSQHIVAINNEMEYWVWSLS